MIYFMINCEKPTDHKYQTSIFLIMFKFGVIHVSKLYGYQLSSIFFENMLVNKNSLKCFRKKLKFSETFDGMKIKYNLGRAFFVPLNADSIWRRFYWTITN